MTFLHSLAVLLTVGALNRCQLPAQILSQKEKLGAQSALTIEFDKDSSQLSEREKEKINTFLKDISGIKKIYAVAWSDKEFSLQADLNSADRHLAEKRLHEVRGYLSELNKGKRVKLFNMADKPSWFARVFDTPAAKIKRILSNPGVPPPEMAEEYYRLHSKSSKALILVFSDIEGNVPRH